jgi:hypothetical protein
MKLYPIAAAASLALAISGCTLHMGSGSSGTQPSSAAPVSAGQAGASGAGGPSGTGTASAAPVIITSPVAPQAAPAVPSGPPSIGRCHTNMLRLRVGAGYLWVTPPDETSQLGRRWLGGLVCQHGEIDTPPMQPGLPTP